MATYQYIPVWVIGACFLGFVCYLLFGDWSFRRLKV